MAETGMTPMLERAVSNAESKMITRAASNKSTSSPTSADNSYISAFGLEFSDDCYQVFTPNTFSDDNASKIIKNISETSTAKVQSRIPRTLLSLLIPSVILPAIAVTDGKTLPIARAIGIAILLMFIGYFLHLFSIFFQTLFQNNTNIYRIYSLNSIKRDWAPMIITYRALIFKGNPIESISEFSAINGGIAQTMLLSVSTNAWALIICVIAFEFRTEEFKIGFSDICQIIGCFGLVLIGTYELDPFNKTMKRIHNSGSFLGLFTLVGYFHQQCKIGIYHNNIIKYIWYPILINIIAIISYILWQYYGKKAENYPKELRRNGNIFDPQTVTKMSLQNLISEAIFLFCGALSMCLYLIQYEWCYEVSVTGC